MLGMGGYGFPGNLTLTSSTIPTNGLYLPAANTVGIATNSTLRVSVSTSLVTLASGMGLTLTNGKVAITDTTNETALTVTHGATGNPGIVVIADSLTTGEGMTIASNSANTSARTVLYITNTNTAATGAVCARFRQLAANAFLDFVGTAAANTTDPISTFATAGAGYGWVQVDVNGAKKWIKLYEDPSA